MGAIKRFSRGNELILALVAVFQPTLSRIEYRGQARLWFEPFQNWQSEFVSTAVIEVLSIVRHQGSPESAPVAAPHSDTGH